MPPQLGMPRPGPRLKDKVQNQSRIKIEPSRQGAYSDRIKIDPFAPSYKWPVERKPIERA